jgi:hypothetical protein
MARRFILGRTVGGSLVLAWPLLPRALQPVPESGT